LPVTMFKPRTWLPIVSSLAIGGFCSFWVYLICNLQGLPETPAGNALFHDIPPGGLHGFLAFIMPAAACLPSLAHSVLLRMDACRGGKNQVWPLCLDLAGSLLLLLLIPLAYLWHGFHHMFVLTGLLLLAVTALKGAGLALLLKGRLMKSRADASGPGFTTSALIWLAAFSVLAPLSIWVWRAYSAAGDEVRYLLITHSLVKHGTSDVSAAVRAGEYREFYTGPWHRRMSWDLKRAGTRIFHLMLAPAYFAGKRLGVMLFMAAISALAAAGLLAWLWRGGLSPPSAGAAVLLTMASAPILSLGQHALPDVPGILLFIIGLLILQSFAKAPLKAWAGLLATAALLLATKNRLAFLGAGLLLAGGTEQWIWLRGKSKNLARIWAALIPFFIAALVWITYATNLLQWDMARWWDHYLLQWISSPSWVHPLLVFLGGVGLDQEHGILLLAPIFLLALSALPAVLARMPALARQAGIPVVFYLAVLCFLRWDRFFGGDGPPGRFITATLPALALFMAYAWQNLQKRGWRIIPMLLGGFTLLASLVLTLIPSAHFHRTTGENKLLGLASNYWGHDLHHMFPSSFAADSWWSPWLLGLGILALALGWKIWRNPKASPEQTQSWRGWETGLAGAVVISGLLVFLSLSQAMPPTSLEAEQMEAKGASLYGVVAGGAKPIGRSISPGGKLWGRFYHPGGSIDLVVKGFCERPGKLEFRLDGHAAGMLECEPDRPMVMRISRQDPGYADLEISWSSCRERSCFMFIDRLEIRKPGVQSNKGN
jgi:hypothetical protein